MTLPSIFKPKLPTIKTPTVKLPGLQVDDQTALGHAFKTLRSLGVMAPLDNDLEHGVKQFRQLEQSNPQELLTRLRGLGRTPETETFLKTVRPNISEQDLTDLFPQPPLPGTQIKPPVISRPGSTFGAPPDLRIDLAKQEVRAKALSPEGVSNKEWLESGASTNWETEMNRAQMLGAYGAETSRPQFFTESFETPQGGKRVRIIEKPPTPGEYVGGALEKVVESLVPYGTKQFQDMTTQEKVITLVNAGLIAVPGSIGEAKALGGLVKQGAEQLVGKAAPLARELALGEAGALKFGKEIPEGVLKAAREGKPIPPEVLKQYPELAKLQPVVPEAVKPQGVVPRAMAGTPSVQEAANRAIVEGKAVKPIVKEPWQITKVEWTTKKRTGISKWAKETPEGGYFRVVPSEELPKVAEQTLPKSEYYYHYTPLESIENIKKSGLGGGATDTGRGTKIQAETKNRVYALSESNPKFFENAIERDVSGIDPNDWAILRFSKAGKQWKPDPEFEKIEDLGKAFFSNSKVKSSEIEVLTKDGWKPISNFSTRESGEHERLVSLALSEGKSVPPEVLKDYPELTKAAKALPQATESLKKPVEAVSGIGTGKAPPNTPLGTIEGMWEKGRKVPKKSPDAFLKAQEYGNDIYYGLRTMQSRVAKNLPIVPGGPNDVTTLLTRAPGAANAGATRYIGHINFIKKVWPDVMADDINTILYVNHAKEVLAAKGPERIMAGGFKNPAELDKALTELESIIGKDGMGKTTAAAEYIKNVYAGELDSLVSEGIISKELAKELQEKYSWYNPLQYIDTAEEMAAKGKSVRPYTVISSGLKRLSEKGTSKEAIAPLNLLGDQLIRNEVRIVKNQTAKAIITLAKEDKTLTSVKKISGIRPIANVEGKEIFRPTTQDVPGTLSFFENGKRQIYQVPDFIYREANVLNQMTSNPVSSLVGALNGVSRAAFTSVSPPFVVSNILSDMLPAFVNRGIMLHETAIRLVESLRGLENDKVMQAFRLAGGYQQRFYGRTANELAKEVGVAGGEIIKSGDNFLKKIWRFIPAAGEAGEQAPRTALFKRELNRTLPGWQTMTVEEIAASPQGRKAAADAVELTINFGRGAYLIKAANPFVIFLNANMEGMKLPMRALRSNPAARWRLAGVAAGATGIAAYNLSYPEYMDIPNNIRWGSFVIMLPPKEKNPDGTNKPNYVTIIPRTREWGALLGSLTYGMERMYADAPAEFGTFSGTIAPLLAPLSEVPGPALIQELTAQLANYDFYFSSPVVSPSLQNLPASEQVQPSTSRTIQLGANVLGVSPVRAQHAVNGIFGGAAKAITSVTDLVANLLAPQPVDPYIKNLAEQYQNMDKTGQTAFLARMSASDKKAMTNYLNKPQQQIPILGLIGKRIMPGQGGRLADVQYQLEQSVKILPKYWLDIMTSEQMKQVDVKFWTDKKKTDARLIQDYNLQMMGKSDYDREQYRIKNPGADVILNFWGQLSTVKSLAAANRLSALASQYNIPLTSIPAFGKTDSGYDKLPPQTLWPDFFGYFAIQYEGKTPAEDKILEAKQTKERGAFRKSHPAFYKWGQQNGLFAVTTTSSSSRGTSSGGTPRILK